MDKVNMLNMTISDEPNYFIFSNVSMDTKTFEAIVRQIEKIFGSLYAEKGAEAYVQRTVDENNKISLKVTQSKVPNIIKSLVQSPEREIQFTLTGINPQKEMITRTIKKPFTANEVTELVPCYHNKKANTEEQKKTTKR